MMTVWRKRDDVTEINGRRCTGHCCRRFYLPMSPEELRAEAKKWPRGESRYNSEVMQVAGMVVYLGPSLVDVNGERRSAPGHYYTCGYHSPLTGNCLIYSLRPPMCREYPYGRECSYHACAGNGACQRSRLLRPLWRLARWWRARWSEWTKYPPVSHEEAIAGQDWRDLLAAETKRKEAA